MVRLDVEAAGKEMPQEPAQAEARVPAKEDIRRYASLHGGR